MNVKMKARTAFYQKLITAFVALFYLVLNLTIYHDGRNITKWMIYKL